MQIIFQDSVGSLDPRMRVRDLVGEGLAIHGVPARGARRSRRRRARPRRSRRGDASPLPAPVQRRPAPADRHRPRARAAAEARRRRRAGVRARRVDPVAGAEPARRAEAGVRAHLPLRRARPRRRRLHLRPHRGHVSRQDRRARRRRRICSRGPLHPYTQALLSAIPTPEPGRKTSAHRAARATCRARSIHRAAAASARAARSRSRSAPRRSRRSSRTATAISPPATSPARRSPSRSSTRSVSDRIDVRLLHDQRVPTRDGITLSADVYLPLSGGVAADDRAVDAVRVDARALHRMGRVVRASWLRRRRRRCARPLRVGRRVLRMDEGRRRRARHAHVGGRAAVVQRPDRHVGTELRRARPVAARAPRAPEPSVRLAERDPRRLLLGRLLHGRRVPARADARRGGALEQRAQPDHRAERAPTSSSTTACSATCR